MAQRYLGRVQIWAKSAVSCNKSGSTAWFTLALIENLVSVWKLTLLYADGWKKRDVVHHYSLDIFVWAGWFLVNDRLIYWLKWAVRKGFEFSQRLIIQSVYVPFKTKSFCGPADHLQKHIWWALCVGFSVMWRNYFYQQSLLKTNFVLNLNERLFSKYSSIAL